ncbi:MAG: alpha/beta hydrolase [Proteobacteria bacterium]|jgi:pimeloyl-ACP methyl ester carboxylesterase|nr:alpha/beta hydrolase [Ottowia sp.]MBP9953814.1 alpha/beta hydrolase [Ottowia sp.]MCA0310905.1 alpha/beta hydrolase [Pseudomonadota bacterium]HMT16631.1 alpha/beta hydrolase [Ottowia sp.]HPP97381.1 alpha/beta hydrolase [Ottowia sp.]
MTEPVLHHVSCPDASGGHRMAYWQWGDAAAAHLVVCVHGLSRQGRDFDVLARALLARAAAQGQALRVVCPDVVGRGDSDWLKEPMGYQFPTYVGDMLTLLGTLAQQAPIARLDWVGTSMGGLIGLMLAGAPDLPLPLPMRRLVLNDVGPVIEWQALQRIGQYLGKSGPFESVEAGAARLRELAPGFGPHTDAQWLALSRPMLRPAPQGGWRLHYDPAIAVPYAAVTEESSAQGEALLWQLYDQVTAETLVLRGADSDLLSAATARAMQARGPRPRVLEFAGVGHAPTLVADDQVAAVCDFLLRADRAP